MVSLWHHYGSCFRNSATNAGRTPPRIPRHSYSGQRLARQEIRPTGPLYSAITDICMKLFLRRPLRGESARGRSPQSSRRGANAASRRAGGGQTRRPVSDYQSIQVGGGDGRGCARHCAGGTPALPGGHHRAGGTPALPGSHHRAGGTPALPGSHHCAGGTPALPGSHHRAGGTPALPGSHHCAGGTPALPGGSLLGAACR